MDFDVEIHKFASRTARLFGCCSVSKTDAHADPHPRNTRPMNLRASGNFGCCERTVTIAPDGVARHAVVTPGS
jgi:hypothetical protein